MNFLEWLGIIASIASIISLLFAAWLYHKEQLSKVRESSNIKVLKERLKSNNSILRSTLLNLQILIRQADDPNTPVRELQNMARQVRANLAALAIDEEQFQNMLNDWKIGKYLESGTNPNIKKQSE